MNDEHSAAALHGRSDRPVLLVTNYRPDNQHSMLRYAELLTGGLRKLGVDVRVIEPSEMLARLPSSWRLLQRVMRTADKFLLFPLLLRGAARRFHAETGGLVHVIDQGNGVYVSALRKVPLVVTCHDLIAVKETLGMFHHPGAEEAKKSVYQTRNLARLREVRWFACVSHATRQDCLTVLGAEPSRCEVIPNPLDPFFSAPAGARPPGLPERYLLSMGNMGWYKNRPASLQIYAALRARGCTLPLVIMGGALSPAEGALARDLGIADHLVPCHHPDDATVRASYAHAEALFFPSLEEGFGWPIIEAQAQGCLVVTTNRPPMTETGGSTALYVDPSLPEEAAPSILPRLEEARAAGPVALRRAHALSFSVEAFAVGYRRLYQRVLMEWGAGIGVRQP